MLGRRRTAPTRKTRVAQRFQPLHERRVESSLLGQFLPRRILTDQLPETRSKFFRHRLLLSIKVLSFGRIFRKIVELRLWSLDKLILLGFDRPQLAPVEMQ